MTTVGTHIKTASDAKGIFVLPDPPRFPDDMTSFDYLAATGNAHHLIEYLGNRDTTIVAGDRYVVLRPTRSMVGSHYPDMLVAFDVDPSLYKASNGYIISDHGKPPDFVLEIASPRTGRNDAGRKRVDYAKIGVPEYWRFDETGDYHGTRLAGDHLIGDEYAPIEIVELTDGSLQGYSEVLDVHLRWDHGVLRWHDPATGEHIPSFHSERERALEADLRAGQAELRADAANARIRDLEAEVRRLRGMI